MIEDAERVGGHEAGTEGGGGGGGHAEWWEKRENLSEEGRS